MIIKSESVTFIFCY